MKPFALVPALAVILATSLVPLSAEEPESQSAAAVVPLKALLAQQKLDALAARDPEHSFGSPGTGGALGFADRTRASDTHT